MKRTRSHPPLKLPKKAFVPYKKVVVPTSLRSVYWKYFGFPADENAAVLTKERVVCILCRRQMVHHGNTSNLRTHLQTHHSTLAAKIEAENTKPVIRKSRVESLLTNSVSKVGNLLEESLENVELTDYDVVNDQVKHGKRRDSKDTPNIVLSEEASDATFPDINIIFPNAGEYKEYTLESMEQAECAAESTELNDAIMNFIIADLVPPSVVSGSGFRTLMSHSSDLTVTLPSEQKLISDVIPSMYQTTKAHLFNTLIANSITNISLSIEEWTCMDNVKCLSFFAHYLQNNEPVLISKYLTTLFHTGDETVHDWDNLLDKVFNEWNINYEAISVVLTAFSIDELKTVLCMKRFTLLPCFLQILNELCVDHCFRSSEVASLLKKCRDIAQIAQEIQIGEDESSVENDDEYELRYSSLDRPQLWMTTYHMLKGLLRRQQFISELSSSTEEENTLSAADWKNIDDLVNLLEPLEMIIVTLFEEKNYAVSLLNPLIWKVSNTSFKISEDDSFLVRKLKQVIKKGLNDAYAELSTSSFLRTAMLMDPRFKSLLPEREDSSSEPDIIELLTDFVNAEGLVSSEVSTENENSKKPTRLSGINVLFSDFQIKKQPSTPENKIKQEVSFYEAQDSALLEMCPLEWWQNMNNKMPNLVRLARKYLCVPAMITLPGYNNIEEYTRCYDKRAALRFNVVDHLLFLHFNRST